MKKIKTVLLVTTLMFGVFILKAETSQGDSTKQESPSITKVDSTSSVIQKSEFVEMADRLRADGKIYVVVAIILVILAGFLTYLVILDKKIGKLEKALKDRQS